MKAIRVLVVSIFLSGFLVSPDAEARRATKMIEPGRVSFACAHSIKDVRNGIHAAMIGLGWSPNYTDAGVEGNIVVRGKHTLNVLVKYDTRGFDIDYVSSENLKYKVKNGQRYIHSNAIGWMQNLKNAINDQLLRADCLD